MPPAELTLLTKPGCHLCDEARDVVNFVISEISAEDPVPPVVLSELSILDDAALLEQYAEEIPVLLIDGRVHAIWRVDAARLRAALLKG